MRKISRRTAETYNTDTNIPNFTFFKATINTFASSGAAKIDTITCVSYSITLIPSLVLVIPSH